MNKYFIKSILLSLVTVMCINIRAANAAENAPQKNVLLIIVDDLRAQLGCYGDSKIITPNIDKLAEEGAVFLNAYCNYPICGPSRASLFSGLRPHKNRFTGNHALVGKEVPAIVPMNTFFKNQGYATVSLGKVYHSRTDSKDGWTEAPWGAADNDPKKRITGWRDYLTKENQELCKTNEKKAANAYEIADVKDEEYYDGKTALKAIKYLSDFKTSGKPFFMTVGFVKPHLPFNAPKKYFDMYPEEQISLPDNYFFPKNAPKEADHMWYELRAYNGIPKQGPVDDDMALKLIRGYRACTSYADAMVGKVLDELKKLDLDKNTVVVLIGDHGWHLGEHTLWAKHSNFEKTLRTTMIVHNPETPQNIKVNAPTELVDIYPTLCELTGQKLPNHLEGESVMPLLKDPNSVWKEAVYSKFSNAWSVATERYLYTEWKDEKGNTIARMLYDHKNDPEENENIAERQNVKDVLDKHVVLLQKYYENQFN